MVMSLVFIILLRFRLVYLLAHFDSPLEFLIGPGNFVLYQTPDFQPRYTKPALFPLFSGS